MAGSFDRLQAAVRAFASSTGGRPPTKPGARIPPGMIGVEILDDSRASDAGLSRIFDAFDATIDDLPAVLRDAVPAIRDGHRSVFTTEGSAGRGRWAPLAPTTIRQRLRLGFGSGPIHVRTGALRDHVLNAPVKVTTRGRTVRLEIRPANSVGGVPKYVALALGTRNIPARPMIALGPAAAVKVTSEISRSLRRRARAHGLQ